MLKNSFRRITLIEYAAFFGSNQIFKYLYLNGAKLTASIWKYAIHGEDAEIIHLLEENKIKLPLYVYENIIEKSIKFHSINITNYFLQDEDKKNELLNDYYLERIKKLNQYSGFDLFGCITAVPSFKYHNYLFFPNKLDNPFNFGYLCKYNYINFVKILFKTKKILVNQKIILNLYLCLWNGRTNFNLIFYEI